MSHFSNPNNPDVNQPDVGSDPSEPEANENKADISSLRSELDHHLNQLSTISPDSFLKKPSEQPPSFVAKPIHIEPSRSEKKGPGTWFFIVVASVLGGIIVDAAISQNPSQRVSSPVGTGLLESDPQEPSAPKPFPKTVSTSQPSSPASTETQPSSANGSESTQTSSDTPAEETTSTVKWQACMEDGNHDAASPQPGEVWWPVVGPGESLDDAQRHCRNDAFINKSGNAQIASFRDQQVAASFAEQLSQDGSHPWRFWVGDPTAR